MTGTIPVPAARQHRAASRRCAVKAFACLLTVVTTACFVSAASDTTGPSGAISFRPPPQPPPPPTNPTTPAPTESDTVLVTPNTGNPGYAIGPNFQGLSLEIWDAINNPRLADPALEQFLANLGPGVIRVGGITADEHWWNPTTRVARSDGAPVITNADFTTLFAFSRATKWPVIYTVNLANQQPDTAAAEVQALAAAGGSSLLGVTFL